MFPLFRGKKGITPIIAVILLLMMTVAAAGAAFYWLSRIQGQMQGGVESYQGQIFETMASGVDVVDADYGWGDDNLTIYLQNVGNAKVSVSDASDYPTTTWILRDADQAVVCSTDWSGTGGAPNCVGGLCGDELDVGQIAPVSLDLGGTDCEIETDYAEGEVFTLTIDFSGQVTTSGSFIS